MRLSVGVASLARMDTVPRVHTSVNVCLAGDLKENVQNMSEPVQIATLREGLVKMGLTRASANQVWASEISFCLSQYSASQNLFIREIKKRESSRKLVYSHCKSNDPPIKLTLNGR